MHSGPSGGSEDEIELLVAKSYEQNPLCFEASQNAEGGGFLP